MYALKRVHELCFYMCFTVKCTPGNTNKVRNENIRVPDIYILSKISKVNPHK